MSTVSKEEGTALSVNYILHTTTMELENHGALQNQHKNEHEEAWGEAP